MKMIKIAAGFLSLLVPFVVSAGTYDDATAPVQNGLVTSTDCGALASAAKVNLSPNVVAALHCRSIWGDAKIATCHAKGNVSPTEETCGCVDVTPTGATTQVWETNISTCTGTCNSTGTYSLTTADTVLLAGRKAFGANTSGGQLQTFTMGDTGLCDNSNLTTISLF